MIYLIFLIGLALRLYGVAWDQGFYLNPDERFLVMVANSLQIPTNLWEYFNPNISSLNPYNQQYGFFVYSHFPLILTKLLSVVFNYDNYAHFYQLARPITALIDASVIPALYLICKVLFSSLKAEKSRQIGLFTALLYAVFVLPIQQAHFFTVDSYVNAFFIWSLYFTLSYSLSKAGSWKSLWALLFSAIFFSFAIASKVIILVALPLILIILLIKKTQWFRKLIDLFIFLLISYLSLRLVDPYLFKEVSFFNPQINPLFIDNLKQLSHLGNQFFPPAVQWYSKNAFFPFFNIAVFGIGLAFFSLLVYGILLYIKKIIADQPKKKRWEYFIRNPLLIICGWVVAYCIFQSFQLAKTMRYYIFLYPFFAIFGGYALSYLSKPIRTFWFIAGFIWTLAFLHIYSVPHSRVQASYWIYENLPNQAKIIWEYWDDPLPLAVNNNKQFELIRLDAYLPDSEEKWQQITKDLEDTDYIILSSNRQWGSIPLVPELYPNTSRYYSLLLQNKLGFNKIKEFTSYPQIGFGAWQLEFPDDSAEEAFTVYDHPKVIILKKNQDYDKDKLLIKIGVKKAKDR